MIPYDVLMYHTFASFLHIIKCRFSPDQKTHAARPAAGDFFGMDQWTNGPTKSAVIQRIPPRMLCDPPRMRQKMVIYIMVINGLTNNGE